MPENLEFILVHDFKTRPFLNKWEKKLLIPLIILVILYAIYLQDKDGSGVRLLSNLALSFTLLAGFNYVMRKRKYSIINRIAIAGNKLSVYSKNSILWQVDTRDITEIIIEEPKTVFGIATRNKAFIIRKADDSFYFSLNYAKFQKNTVNEVADQIKQYCKI